MANDKIKVTFRALVRAITATTRAISIESKKKNVKSVSASRFSCQLITLAF